MPAEWLRTPQTRLSVKQIRTAGNQAPTTFSAQTNFRNGSAGSAHGAHPLNQQRLDQRIADIRFFRLVLNADQKKKMDEIHKQFLAQMKDWTNCRSAIAKWRPTRTIPDDQPEGAPGQGPRNNNAAAVITVHRRKAPKADTVSTAVLNMPPDGNGPQNGQLPAARPATNAAGVLNFSPPYQTRKRPLYGARFLFSYRFFMATLRAARNVYI